MRIRSVKPEFFRHKGLQKLERDNPGQYVMLTYEGLWSASDKQGVFVWDADYLHLDILPFLTFDFEKTLSTLEAAGEIVRFAAEGKEYGYIYSFKEHQRISGEEAKQEARHPAPVFETQEGSRREAGGKQEGSRREDPSRPGKGNGVGERSREGASQTPRVTPEKKTYGEFQNVRLLDTEFDSLVTQYGPAGADALVQKLSSYKESKGKTYKSDIAAIRQWVIEAVKPSPALPPAESKQAHCPICGTAVLRDWECMCPSCGFLVDPGTLADEQLVQVYRDKWAAKTREAVNA